MEEKWLKLAHYGLGGDLKGCAEMTKSNAYLNKLNPSSDVEKMKRPSWSFFVSATTKKKVKQSQPR